MQSEAVLRDGSLRLRPAVLPDDIATAVPWYHDLDVLRFSEGEGTPPYDAEQVGLMFRSMATRCEVYIIEILTSAGWFPIGDAALCGEAGVPIVIGEAAYRSCGFGTRVLRLLIERGRDLGLPRLVVQGVYAYNDRARRLYERAGFRTCGQVHDDAGHLLWQYQLPLR